MWKNSRFLFQYLIFLLPNSWNSFNSLDSQKWHFRIYLKCRWINCDRKIEFWAWSLNICIGYICSDGMFCPFLKEILEAVISNCFIIFIISVTLFNYLNIPINFEIKHTKMQKITNKEKNISVLTTAIQSEKCNRWISCINVTKLSL